jgi:hypothetical protein
MTEVGYERHAGMDKCTSVLHLFSSHCGVPSMRGIKERTGDLSMMFLFYNVITGCPKLVFRFSSITNRGTELQRYPRSACNGFGSR